MKQMVYSTLAIKVGSWGDTGRPCVSWPHLSSARPTASGGDPKAEARGLPGPTPLLPQTRASPAEWPFPCWPTIVKSACSISSSKIRRGMRYRTMSLASFRPARDGGGRGGHA